MRAWESRRLRMFNGSLVYYFMRLGVPFIAPRQLGAVEDQLGRQILPSVEWCTGQFGAPPDMNSTCPVLDFLPNRAQSTVGPRVRLARATCRPLIAQPTVGRERLCLTGQSGAPPDSPVIYSHIVALIPESRDFAAGPA